MKNSIIKSDSVQNGVGLLRLSIRLVELQNKPFLSIEMMMTKMASWGITNFYSCHYIRL